MSVSASVCVFTYHKKTEFESRTDENGLVSDRTFAEFVESIDELVRYT